jgi:hypothetical protein
MPHAKHNCRVKELLVARRAAANGFWQNICQMAKCGSLSLKKSRKWKAKIQMESIRKRTPFELS